jgi:acyl phosphate:glycerol-3-phosphate acyltransferase
MTAPTALLALIPVAYLAGAIPFGLLVGKAKGIDVRTAGSKNIGATNVGRILGKKYFWLVFTLDLLKSLLPVLAAGFLIHFNPADWITYLLWMLVGFAAVAGHMFSIFLKFKGGKGVSTSAGVLLGIWPYFTLPGLCAVAVFVLVYKSTRYISAASIIGTSSFPVWYILFGIVRGWPIYGDQLPLLIAAVLLTGMIVYKHKANIGRLLAGTELRSPR